MMEMMNRMLRRVRSGYRRWLTITAIFAVAAVGALQILPRSEYPGRAEALLPESTQIEGPLVALVDGQRLTPTFSWINAFGFNSTLNGQPLPVGALVAAYDPQGTLVGRTIVKREGQYGLLALYMDDPSTPVDEGASPGDVLTFEVDGLAAQVLGPSKPIWTTNGDILELNLAASTEPLRG